MKSRILVIEDDQRIIRMLTRYLGERDFTVHGVSDLQDLEHTFTDFAPDLILLDWNLQSQKSGIEILHELRNRPDQAHLPVIMLTARNEEMDRVEGLNTGADDYIVKPFSLAELEARILSVLRRTTRSAPPYEDDYLQIIPEQKRLVVNTGKELLSIQEWGVLEALLKARDGVSRAELVQRVWGADHPVTERSIDVLVLRIRRIIEPNPETPRYLVTERGLGYRFVRRSSPQA